MSPSYSFSEVTISAQKKGVCPVCGRGVIRRERFWQTESPFNRNDDGTVRTRDEIYAAVTAEADNWVPDFTHVKCRVAS